MVIPTPARLLERLHATGCTSRLLQHDPAVIPAVRDGIGIRSRDLDREQAKTRDETGASRTAPEAPPRGGVGLFHLLLSTTAIASQGAI